MNDTQKTVRYHKAFKETYLLINDLSSELYAKIPKSFIKIIKENMDEFYDISIDKLNTEGMMEETEVLMSLIFRDFLCTEEVSQKLIEYDNDQIKQELERYNNIFGNEEKKEEIEVQQDNLGEIEENKSLTVVREENVFIKIINKIKNMFKKKRG